MQPLSTRFCLLPCALGLLLATAAGAAELPIKPGVSDLVKASAPGNWRALDLDNTVYLELPGGRVVIELAPPFAPRHVANIKALVRERYFDGLAVVRAQDNYVVQWGDPDEAKPRPIQHAARSLKAEFTAPSSALRGFTPMPEADGYAPQVGHWNGFPAARDPRRRQAWLAHCYGMVGVGRDDGSDSGSGASLYVVIGHAPRHLDRNITVVGRVVTGMPLLSTLPRGSGDLGFYVAGEAKPAIAMKLAADVPPAERTQLEVMRTDSAAFKAVLDTQRHRGGPWNQFSPGHLNLCNATIPVRPAK